ncbi:hypothetical protein J6X73_01705 [Candidatus Saccharibacteria bacterium]|jgi:hypothetical protein|nr:hypothetical protein [Candidatus Saccharibacteria bacterium]
MKKGEIPMKNFKTFAIIAAAIAAVSVVTKVVMTMFIDDPIDDGLQLDD